MNRLFVYGIFLDESQRLRYGMSNPRYATVGDYATFGGQIVTAYHIPHTHGIGGGVLALSGLLVDVAPNMHNHDNWARLDALEAGYDRIVVTTTNGIEAYMYVGKE